MARLILDQDIAIKNCKVIFKRKKRLILRVGEMEMDNCRILLNPYSSDILFDNEFINTRNRTLLRTYGVTDVNELCNLRERYENKIILPLSDKNDKKIFDL